VVGGGIWPARGGIPLQGSGWSGSCALVSLPHALSDHEPRHPGVATRKIVRHDAGADRTTLLIWSWYGASCILRRAGGECRSD
jgi:hypothetical protein